MAGRNRHSLRKSALEDPVTANCREIRRTAGRMKDTKLREVSCLSFQAAARRPQNDGHINKKQLLVTGTPCFPPLLGLWSRYSEVVFRLQGPRHALSKIQAHFAASALTPGRNSQETLQSVSNLAVLLSLQRRVIAGNGKKCAA